MVVGDDLGAHGTAPEGRRVLSGGFRGFRAFADRPGARLLLAGGEKGDEAERVIGASDQFAESRFGDAQAGEVFRTLLGFEIYKISFELRADDRRVGAFALSVFA